VDAATAMIQNYTGAASAIKKKVLHHNCTNVFDYSQKCHHRAVGTTLRTKMLQEQDNCDLVEPVHTRSFMHGCENR
jgi:hypothetical protein